MKKWHLNDLNNRMYINIGDGKKAAMPRYYKQKIYTDEQRSVISGYQKGKIEKDTIDALQFYDGNASFARDKQQVIAAARKKMELHSSQRQKNYHD